MYKRQDTDWPRARRFCVDPSVHLAAVRGLAAAWRREGRPPLRRVLLATDSQKAVDLFSGGLEGVEVVVADLDRGRFEAFDAAKASQEDYWIEFRAFSNATDAGFFATSAVDDVRHLSRGHVLVGALCGQFARLAHAAMIANNGKEVPVVSVDACTPHCGDNGLEYYHAIPGEALSEARLGRG